MGNRLGDLAGVTRDALELVYDFRVVACIEGLYVGCY